MSYEQHPPFAVQVEATEGCNLSCTFCAMNSIRESNGGPYYYMETATAEFIASEMAKHGWTSRIEFAMHGEPSMNENLHELVAAFRKHLPNNQIMVTSNGGGFLGKLHRIPQLFEAGANILALDNYDSVTIVPRLIKQLTEERVKEWGATLRFYPEDPEGNPHRRLKKGARLITILEDLLTADVGTHSILTNQAGQAFAFNDEQSTARCAKPFRELSIRYDGNVSICCNDFRGVFKVGNVLELGLHDLWQHPRFQAARKKLYHGQRDFGVCKGCNARSYRVGLLPDQRGKMTLPMADAADEQHLKDAMAGLPYGTIQVKRAWDDLKWIKDNDGSIQVHELAKVDQQKVEGK